MSRDEMATARRASNDTAGKPLFYTHNSGQIEVYPTPDGDYTLDLQYYAKVPALNDTDNTNWILNKYPDIYLYGSLIHASVYLRDPQRTQDFASLYAAAVVMANNESEKATMSGSSLRIRWR